MDTFNADDFINFDNFGDESSSALSTSTSDQTPQPTELSETQFKTANTEIAPQPTDSTEVKPKAISADQVTQNITDSIQIKSNPALDDQAPQPTEQVAITTIKSNTPADPPRIDPETVQTTEQAELFFVYELARRYRFFKYFNALENLNKEEIIDALYDALEEINEMTPQSDYTLLKLVSRGRRYRRVLILGAAKYCVITLISHWTSDGIDVTVEDLSVSSKLSDFQSLLSTISDQFTERLKELKAYDRLTIKTSTFSTGARRFATASVTTRVGRLVSSGRRIG